MVAYDEKDGIMKHFRVDKMKSIAVLQEKRVGKDKFDEADIATYSTMNFAMHSGEKKDVKISFRDDKVGVIIDRFGKNISIHPSKKEGWSETTVQVCVSNTFFGWIFSLGSEVTIAGPKDVVKMFEEEVAERAKLIRVKY